MIFYFNLAIYVALYKEITIKIIEISLARFAVLYQSY
jgi:hypothetical protein